MPRYILFIEYSKIAAQHPVYVRVSDGKSAVADVGSKSLRTALAVAMQRIYDHETEKA